MSAFDRRQPTAAIDEGGAQDEDLRLVRAAMARDSAAEERLIQRMRVISRILRALNLRLGAPLDDDELLDVAQDSTILLWSKLSTFTGVSTLESWFFGVARNKLLNAVRAKRRRSEGIESSTTFARPEDPAMTHDVERLRFALDRLPRDEAHVVTLYYYEGLTLEQVARRLGSATSTIKSRYYRGLERLVEFLGRRAAAEER